MGSLSAAGQMVLCKFNKVIGIMAAGIMEKTALYNFLIKIHDFKFK